MQRNYAVHSATKTIDVVLEKGAQNLYNKYLNHKLPPHAHHQNATMFLRNLNLHEVVRPDSQPIEVVPLSKVQAPPIDQNAPKRIPINKSQVSSILSAKQTIFCNSTKYQTIVSAPRSTSNHQQHIYNQNSSLLLEELQEENTELQQQNGRPMTIQTARSMIKGNQLMMQSKVEGEGERRAATCHTRNRKKYISSKQKMSRMVKIKEEKALYFPEQIEVANRFKGYKRVKMQQQKEKQQQKVRLNAQYDMKERRARQCFQSLRKKLKGKNIQNPPLCNFESQSGQITINGHPKQQQRTHIIQLEFNPEEERTLKSHQPKVMGVNSVKKGVFMSKAKKTPKLTPQEYTNNGERQVSSIPYVTLSCGIALSQSTLSATASRRRPVCQVSREQFNCENSSHKFKSHIPIVNSAGIDVFETIDENCQQTARSSYFDNTISVERKEFETTSGSNKHISGSILWRPRTQSQGRNIRISNKQAYKEQLLA